MAKNAAMLHGGHRARMRQRFLETGGAGMADHELLELLLYYTLPRRDTNETAHALIEECGSLSSVLEAGTEELCACEGVGESTAIFLRLLGELSHRYAVAKMESGENIPMYDTPAKIAAYLFPRFLGLTVERVYLLLFDNGLHLLDCYHVCDGSLTGAALSVRRIAERAYRKGAAGVVLAHNHPGGLAVPSGDDIHFTRRLDEALRLLEIPLIEHYVFSDRSYAPIMSSCRATTEGDYAASSLFDVLHRRLGDWCSRN